MHKKKRVLVWVCVCVGVCVCVLGGGFFFFFGVDVCVRRGQSLQKIRNRQGWHIFSTKIL